LEGRKRKLKDKDEGICTKRFKVNIKNKTLECTTTKPIR
jgi:hypothetical protein